PTTKKATNHYDLPLFSYDYQLDYFFIFNVSKYLSTLIVNSSIASFAPLTPSPASKCLKIAPPSTILIMTVPVLLNFFPIKDKIKNIEPINSKNPTIRIIGRAASTPSLNAIEVCSSFLTLCKLLLNTLFATYPFAACFNISCRSCYFYLTSVFFKIRTRFLILLYVIKESYFTA